MLTHLKVQNFRGFRSMESELSPLTAFLGPNSAGKTTALHAIRLACDALKLALDSNEPVLPTKEDASQLMVADGMLVQASQLLPLTDWKALLVDRLVSENSAFEIVLTFEDQEPIQEIAVTVVCARNEQLKLTVVVRSTKIARLAPATSGKNRKVTKTTEVLTPELLRSAPLAVFVPPFYGTILEEELRSGVVVNRLLGSGDQSHVVRNLIAALDTEAFTRLNSFLSDTIGVELTYRTSGDALQTESPLRVRFRDSNGALELSSAGSGLINLIALYSALLRWRHHAKDRTVLFLIDEPEAHLHPRLQAEATSRLGRVVTQEFGAQLILATHSVDILNRLADEGHLLLRCDRRAEPSVISLTKDSELFDELSGWADLTPYSAINFLASRRVIFVEGASELTLLPLLGQLRYRNDQTRLTRFKQWHWVELEGTGNRPVADLLSRLLKSSVINASAQHGEFRVVVVLDRDYEGDRTPGEIIKTSSDISETTFVWSKHSLESLFTDPYVLLAWLRAFLKGDAPPDLQEVVASAVAAVDEDVDLNQAAAIDISAALIKRAQREGQSLFRDHEKPVKDAMKQAQTQVKEAPSQWQRGKDRANRILGKIRDRLPPSHQGHFPTDVVKLISRTDLNRIGVVTEAIPSEIQRLLERLADA